MVRKESLGGLFNLAEVSKQVKKADTVYWSITEDGANIVSDGHFIFRFFGTCDALFARFQAKPAGVVLNSTKGREVFEAPTLRECFDKFLDTEQNAECADTRLTYDSTGRDAKSVRVIYSQSRDFRTFVYIASDYFACIAQAEHVTQEAASGKKPVTFQNYEETEKAVILPVNITEKPFGLAEL